MTTTKTTLKNNMKLYKTTFGILASGASFYYGYELFDLNEKFYEKQIMPLIHKFTDAETAHNWAVKMAKYGILISSKMTRKEYPELQCTVFGRDFKNPIGIAAGFDKNGEAIKNLQKTGLGFVEIGSVVPLPQKGNEKPRIFRLLEDQAIINRYGFNSDGIGVVSERARKSYDPDSPVLLGINIGKNKTSSDAVSDYELGVNYLSSYCDYLVINVSSPNTPGLRALQSKNELIKILKAAKSTLASKSANQKNPPPPPKILLKIAPDLSGDELKDIAKLVLDVKNGVDGLIISNTTISRSNNLISENREEIGGLSGKPLRELSNQCISDMYRLTQGKIPIIGCGGVSSGEDAYEKIRLGASLIQFYSGLVYQGFPITGRIKRELVACLKRDGFTNIQQAIGCQHKKSS